MNNTNNQEKRPRPQPYPEAQPEDKSKKHPKDRSETRLEAQPETKPEARPEAQPETPVEGQLAKEVKETAFPIVGIGASAGGLEASTELLKNLPSDTGMAFVLVQHLDPKHISILPELLSRATKMPVDSVKDGMKVEPNHVYVMPPNVNMAIFHGVLNLMPRVETRGMHMTIDYFFRSLAEDQDIKAIGVILSGTASDGALGLKTIKAEGGITFVQDPRSAQYDGMPRSAIAAGVVDFILAPGEIAKELTRIGQHPYVTRPKAVEAVPEAEDDLLNKVFILLRSATGVDFTYYKQATIKRRIARRLVLNKIEKLEDYVRYLQDNPAEAEALYQDILITVTSFFREPETFEVLKSEVFPKIMRDKALGTSIRVWVPGCSTGEEAYSVAISLVEFLEGTQPKPAVQVFATDINGKAIEKARAAVYPESITADVLPERMQRFFVKVEGGFQVSKLVREMCVFAKHDVTRDPPFSKIDLISFRNVLIYLGSVLQKRVIPALHYALQPWGFLLLGASESVDGYTDLFKQVDKKRKIYSKKPAPSRLPAGFPYRRYELELGVGEEIGKPAEEAPPRFDVHLEADRIILDKYAPAGVLINDDLEVLQFRGHTGPYLEPAPGKASFNLLNMARQGLALDLRSAIHEARRENAPVTKEKVRIRYNGLHRDVNVEVVPLRSPSGERYWLVLFRDVTILAFPEAGEAKLAEEKPGKKEGAEKVEIARLGQELESAKKNLQSTIEERDTTVEELRAANEEIQSSNEELQSINEELETAKEELQSSNEELTTVNDELQNRNAELGQVNDDLNNLLGSVNIPIIILGSDLRIRRFTPAAQKTLNVIPTDVGRPIGDIKLKVEIPDLEQMVLNVIESLIIKEQEVRDKKGRWYSVQIRPYKTAENKIEGAVVVLLDIDQLKHSLEQVKESRKEIQEARLYAENIVETARDSLIVLDSDLRIITANRSFYKRFSVSREETENVPIYDLGNKQWNIPRLRQLLEDIIPKSNEFHDYEVEHDFLAIGHKVMLLNARQMTREGREALILLAIEDVTERRRVEKESKRAKELSDALNDINAAITSTLDIDEIMQRVLVETTRALEAESATVGLREDNQWRTKSVYGLPKELIGSTFTDADAPHAVLAIKTREPVAISDALNDDRVNREEMKRSGIRSTFVIPLRIREDVLGAIFFNYHSHSVTFNDIQVDFAKKLSASLSLALENARLYSAEQYISNTLQNALLIMPVKVEGVDFGYLYRSATETARVGGDFYDIFELEHDKVGIVIGDVSGKGIEATSLTAIVKNTFKAHAYEGLIPADIMARTNDLVIKVNTPGNFVTTFLAMLDIKTGELSYCSAGHPPTIIKKKKGGVELLEQHSPVIGAFSGLQYISGKAKLEKGDILIAYTDGVIEARCNGDFYREERLVELIEKMRPIPAREAPKAIFDDVMECAKGKLSDDVAILTVSLRSE